MEFRILGSLEVVDDGRSISVHRGKEQALLAYLLLHANELVPSDRLIDELWGERAPPTAPKIVQNAVSRLRKALGEGRLVTQPPGYLFRLEPGELDLHRFERLAEEGRAAGDAGQLRQALALWRGEPLANLRDEPFAQRAALHLEETRLAVLEDRIDADLTAGLHRELVPELEQVIGAHPLRERPYGQLMVALYRAGRQADALEAYQRARKTLGAELGLVPGPHLQNLERQILQQDPELALPPRTSPRFGAPTPHAERGTRLAFAAAATIVLAAAAVSLGLIFVLRDDSAPPLAATANSLAVIDPDRNQLVAVVPTGQVPRGVAVGPNGVWVANSADGTVSRVDPLQLKVTQTIGIAEQAFDLVEAEGSVWVATGPDNGLFRIDARSGGVVRRLRLPPGVAASAYAVAAGGGKILVTSGGRLARVDPTTGEARAFFCCNDSIYDVAVGADAIWVLDLSGVVRISRSATRTTGFTTLGTAGGSVTFAYGAVWIGLTDPVRPRIAVWRLDPGTVRVTETLPVGPTTTSANYAPTIDVAAGAGSLWVSNYEAGTVVRLNPFTGNIVSTIRVGGHPAAVAFGAGRVWVTVR